jgi:hypothetical protein
MINITNQNRENQNIWFEKESDNLYTIHTTSKYTLDHACINYEPIPDDAEIYDACWNGKKGLIHSFDPSGGPYMSVGHYEIEGKKLSRIFYDNDKLYFQTL